MRIIVTEKDIKEGKRYTTESCPIANSLRRQFKSNAIVSKYSFCIESNGWQSIDTTREMAEFINDFDKGKKVKPTVFIIKEKKDNNL